MFILNLGVLNRFQTSTVVSMVIYKFKYDLYEAFISTTTYSVTFILFLFDLILYIPSTIFPLQRDGSSWVESVLS